MARINLIEAQRRLYHGETKNIDKNLRKLLRAEKEYALARRIDDELEI